MTIPIYQEVLEAFVNSSDEMFVEPITEGLINQSFKITSKETGSSYILQKINDHVFPEPAQVQKNYVRLWRFLEELKPDYFIPEPKYFPNRNSFFVDSINKYWRVFEYVAGTESRKNASTINEAKAVAETFAKFTLTFANLDPRELETTIPNFHNLSFRFIQFKQSLHIRNYERLQKAADLIHELNRRENYANLYDVMVQSKEFPKRIMHHDAKISNVLFDIDSGEVVCAVDFDTTMPGYFFSDLGDMIRSMAVSHDEASTDFENISIRKEYYEAILDAYMNIIKDILTESEKKYIHHSGIFMIYMQALRFLIDYLNGDIYYRIEYAEQNFDRAKNQLSLLKALESFLKHNYSINV